MSKHSALRLALPLIAALVLQGQSAGMDKFPIVDPSLQMTAFTLTAPTGWNVQGTTLPPSACAGGTAIVAKAVSPDGSMGEYFSPATQWAWGPATRGRGDCLGWQEPVSAKDYLTYYARINKLGYVAEAPFPEADKFSPDFPGETVDQSSYKVRYSAGAKPMEAILNATVVCTVFNTLGVGEQHTCSASVKRWYTPLGKMQAMLSTFALMKARANPEWQQAWAQRSAAKMRGMYERETSTMLEQGRLAGEARMRQHREYMASQQAGADRRDIAFKAGQYQKQNNNDNFIDHILGCSRSYSGNVRISDSDCPNRQTF